MGKLGFFKNISVVIALVVVVYLVANYGGSLKNQIMSQLGIAGSSVKGASTSRAQEISDKFKSDLSSQADLLVNQVLNLKVSDAIDGFSRLQKIPRDAHSLQTYIQSQAATMVQSKIKRRK